MSLSVSRTILETDAVLGRFDSIANLTVRRALVFSNLTVTGAGQQTLEREHSVERRSE